MRWTNTTPTPNTSPTNTGSSRRQRPPAAVPSLIPRWRPSRTRTTYPVDSRCLPVGGRPLPVVTPAVRRDCAEVYNTELHRGFAQLRRYADAHRQDKPPVIAEPRSATRIESISTRNPMTQAATKHKQSWHKHRSPSHDRPCSDRLASAVVGETLRCNKRSISTDAVRTQLQPLAQLEPTSYDGQALNNLSHEKSTVDARRRKHSPSPSSSSSSSDSSRPARCQSSPSSPSSSSSSSESSSSETSDSEDSNWDSTSESSRTRCRCRRRHHHRWHSWCRGSPHRRRSRHPKEKVPVLKPQDPEPYDGSVNIAAFHRFITQCSDYVASYRMSSQRHASVVLCFLKGKAYEFYANIVSQNPHVYRLKNLLEGLFNYFQLLY